MDILYFVAQHEIYQQSSMQKKQRCSTQKENKKTRVSKLYFKL